MMLPVAHVIYLDALVAVNVTDSDVLIVTLGILVAVATDLDVGMEPMGLVTYLDALIAVNVTNSDVHKHFITARTSDVRT